MRPRVAVIAALALALVVVGGVLSACGSEDTSEAAEGEPIEIAGLDYNVQITRFLNPDDTEDSEYLVGMPPPRPGTVYLGVFLVIKNQTGDARPSATNYTVTDTLHNEYDSIDSKSPFALEVGGEVPADSQLPIPDSTAATGPNQGSLLIFNVNDDVSDNRPLRLTIDTFDGSGEIILDI
jgi:hypothetical protein